MAIKQAKEHINEGYKWVVDMGLEKFFDTVQHDVLMNKLSKKIKDKRVLKLIRKYLESGIMMNGLTKANEEGMPQGGPLSPLLSNIMLDELDKELEKRIHEKSYKKFKDKIREATNRNTGISMEMRIKRLGQITTGWINYYGIAKGLSKLKEIQGWIRRRLRACIWKQWKKIRTRHKNLTKLGVPNWKAWE